MPLWDDGSAHGDQYDDGFVQSDVEDSSTLVSQPRQVNKIEVQYYKTSKQVDVQALKGTLWNHIQESHPETIEDQEDQLGRSHYTTFSLTPCCTSICLYLSCFCLY